MINIILNISGEQSYSMILLFIDLRSRLIFIRLFSEVDVK